MIGYAWRVLRRHPGRALPVVAALAAAVAAGAVAASGLRAEVLRLASRTAPVPLPADLLVLLPGPAPAGALAAVGQAPAVHRWEEVPWARAYTPVGAVDAMGLVPGGLLAGRLRLEAGRLPPAAGTAPGSDPWALLPAGPARAAGIRPGSRLVLGIAGPGGLLRDLRVRVPGLYADHHALPRGVLLPPPALEAAAGPAAGRAAWVEAAPGTAPERLRRHVAARLGDGRAVLLDAGAGRRLATRVAGDLRSPAWTLTALAWACSALAAVQFHLAGVLRRRRELGVLRTVGVDDADLRRLLGTEVVGLTLAGVAAGWAAAWLWAGQTAPDGVAPDAGSLLLGATLALPAALLAAWLPCRWVRRAEVQRLLRPYVFGR